MSKNNDLKFLKLLKINLLTIFFVNIIYFFILIPFQYQFRDLSLGVGPKGIHWSVFCFGWSFLSMLLPTFFLFKEKLFSTKSYDIFLRFSTLIVIFSYVLLPIIIPLLPFIKEPMVTNFKKLFAHTIIFAFSLNIMRVALNLIDQKFSDKLRSRLLLNTINLLLLYSFFGFISIVLFFCGSLWGLLIGSLFNIIIALIFSSFGYLKFKILEHYKVFNR